MKPATRILIGTLLLLVPVVAHAANVTVDCSGSTPGAFTSITAALNSLDAVGPHTITVTGTCAEAVNISNRAGITLQAPSNQAASIINPALGPRLNLVHIIHSHDIVLRRLTINGGNFGLLLDNSAQASLENSIIENNRRGIGLNGFSSLSISESSVRNNTAFGIRAESSNLSIFAVTTIENNAGQGINLMASRATIDGFSGGNFIRGNTFSGIRVADNSSLVLGAPNTIQNNGVLGINVLLGSSAQIIGAVDDEGNLLPNIIEGNQAGGIQIIGQAGLTSPNIIRNNGNSSYDFSGGILVADHGTLLATGGEGNDVNEISNNIGAGILTLSSGVLDLAGSMVIKNNTGDGIRLTRISIASFGVDTNLPFTFSGNGGASVFCDTTSLVWGDLTGISNLQCSRIERQSGPPRRGRANPPGLDK